VHRRPPLEISLKSITDQRLALALEAARLGTWTWDMAAGTTTWDVRLEELHGLPPGGFGGTFEDWLTSLHPDDRAECLERVEKALAEPGPYVLLHRTIWADGSVHHIECRGTVLVDDTGAPIGTTGVAIDVSERELHKAVTTEALARERELVNVFQQALLPAALPKIHGTTLAARYIAAEGPSVVGGDWYAVLPLPDGRLGVAIGDVAGHGLDAVADMAAVRFSLRALALSEPAPDRVLERLNQVVNVFESDTMITALYGVLDPKSRIWTYACAGHCPALVRAADGTTVWLDEQCDAPLGVATSFARHHAEIGPGATLVLYTDGLIERRTESIDKGLERLERACREGPADPDGLCDYLSEVMLRESSVEDDVALVVVSLT
jgi:phosphoserine phosphatase RsbU/P